MTTIEFPRTLRLKFIGLCQYANSLEAQRLKNLLAWTGVYAVTAALAELSSTMALLPEDLREDYSNLIISPRLLVELETRLLTPHW